MAPGTYTLGAVEADRGGRQLRGHRLAVPLTIRPPPPAPTGLTLYPTAGTTTASTQPQLTGRTSVGGLVEVYSNPGPKAVLVAQGYSNGSGVFVLTTSKLTPGKYTLEAIAKDAGGNYSEAGSAFVLTIT